MVGDSTHSASKKPSRLQGSGVVVVVVVGVGVVVVVVVGVGVVVVVVVGAAVVVVVVVVVGAAVVVVVGAGPSSPPPPEIFALCQGLRVCCLGLQGNLAYNKMQPPRTLP